MTEPVRDRFARTATKYLAIAFVPACGFMGVASDHYHLPFPKKVLVTVAFFLIAIAVVRFFAESNPFLSLVFFIYGGSNVFVMWYWN